MTAVHSMYRPDAAAMTTHVQHLFGGWLGGYEDGLVELAWTPAEKPPEGGRQEIVFARMFGTDELDELVELAIRLNTAPYCNMYIGAALRHPDTPRDRRSRDIHTWCLPAPYTDLDDKDAFANAKGVYEVNKPTLIVITGKFPHGRAQLWWRLDEPLTDVAAWPALLHGIATRMAGDHSVCNASRLMRLAGSVAWPVKEGRTFEVTGIHPLREPGLSVYMPEHLAMVFPPDPRRAAMEARVVRESNPEPALDPENDPFGVRLKIDDGRERYMRNTVLACLIEYIGTTGAVPDEQELFDLAWPQYERKVSLARPGRGPKEMLAKCRYTLERFRRGELRGLRTVEEVAGVYRGKRSARVNWEEMFGAGTASPSAGPMPPGRFPFEKIEDLRKLPPIKWLVRDWIPEGTTGLFYGKWATGKSFIGFDLSLHLAYGMSDWHGAELPQGGADVLVIAREGHQGFVQRIDAFRKQYELDRDTDRIVFMRAAVSFMRDDEFAGLCNAIKTLPNTFRMVMVDTVARVIPGIEMGKPDAITLFMERCSRLSELTNSTVLGIHHQNKLGTMVGSVFFEANSDFVYEITRVGEADEPLTKGEILCTKMKDGEDRWKRTVTFKKISLATSFDARLSSLVVDFIVDPKSAPQDPLPDANICDMIMKAIDKAWQEGNPVSQRKETREAGRYAPLIYARAFDVPAWKIVNLLKARLENGTLVDDVFDMKQKKRGLRLKNSTAPSGGSTAEAPKGFG